MKRIFITLTLLLFSISPMFAHYLWLETDRTGSLNKEQEVRVYFGEYTYGVIEKVKGENYPSVSKFTLWLIHPNGKKTALKISSKEEYYVAHFTPNTNGTYTVALNNDDIEVLDYTEWDFGIFKTHYQSTAKVQVGDQATATKTLNQDGIVIKELPGTDNQITLQVLFKGKPLAKNEFKLYVSDLWSKTIETDENGEVSFSLPWNTKYTMETTFEERVPGTFNGKEYEFIWHCATYFISK
ncbi:MAG TPA: DUF4198 domain-containing protein [Maribacter sp.]|uniref:DUF4198 domain-containing protein n=1 Tax=unclassified Maribacter TaxID=2615042 RepID=UPI000EBB56E4|nr:MULTISPECIES: DUF4198 domain-containing protein [unclassified Maribacter]HAF78230.1 DUF4198 domain-containing protein [Maribacter sp.]